MRRRQDVAVSGKSLMTLLQTHHVRPLYFAGANRFPFARLIKRTRTEVRKIHRAIAVAKIRRLRRELMLHSRTSDEWTRPLDHEVGAERDVARIPRTPLVLGEKWDY
jgi:hypothetical protein